MTRKGQESGNCRGDNTVCGFGARLRRLTAGICLITQTIFPVMAAAPTHIKDNTHQSVSTPSTQPNVRTTPYMLGVLESPQTVAARFGITVDELRRLNQFRTFARGFDNVRQGDELDVPLMANNLAGRNLKEMQAERDGKDPQLQVAEVAQRGGSLLSQEINSDYAEDMARGWVASSASAQASDWLSRWGTAQVSLGIDEDFSLKSSSVDFLHPWYETPNNLVFSQHTLHRTDDRTQTNHGIGWRYFASDWMSGANLFIDHDLTRYHTRTGMGIEYWRDYLKLGGNAYLRLSNWRSAPELDNDYEARPANGWDLRAEGWLPVWPQLGGKLVFEQYYGDEVALFGKDERQSDPYSITAGLSYTPVPLISFSAEQRQGKQGENDTKIGMELTLQTGHSLQKQLDPDEVAARRSLVGNRYDLVDRNNNIILEYRKKELIRLTLTDPLKGNPGEVKSLVSSLQTKYALKAYGIDAAILQSAGGEVAVSGKDIQVTIPPYRFTATPETDNAFPIAVTAEDTKGNYSRREESMVVVARPQLSLTSSMLTVDPQTLLADEKSMATLTYSAHDANNHPIPGMTLKTVIKGVQQDVALSEWKDNGDGTYTQVITAGKTSGSLSLMPQFNGEDVAKMPVMIGIVANGASRDTSTIETDQSNYIAGKPILVTVTLKDDKGNLVSGNKDLLNNAVMVDNTKSETSRVWIEESDGIYKGNYTADLSGDALTVQLTLPGWKTKHSDKFNIAADKTSAKISDMRVMTVNVVADTLDMHTVQVTVNDEHGNIVKQSAVSFKVTAGAALFVNGMQQITVDTGENGIAAVNLTSNEAKLNTVEAEINGISQSVDVNFNHGNAVAQNSAITLDRTEYAAGELITVTVTLRDAQGNAVPDGAALLSGSSVTVEGADGPSGSWTGTDGTYTATWRAKTAGDDYHAALKLAGWSENKRSDTYIIRASEAVSLNSAITLDRTEYAAGEPITVTVTLRDAQGNAVPDGAALLSGSSVTVEGADGPSGSWTGTDGTYTATWRAKTAGDDYHATLKLAGWSENKRSDAYAIRASEPVKINSTIRTDKTGYTVGEKIIVTVMFRDEYGNPVPGLAAKLAGSYLETYEVGGVDVPDSDGWADHNNGEYTMIWTAKFAQENLVAKLKLITWDGEITSSLYKIISGMAAYINSNIVTDATVYTAGDRVMVTINLFDEFGNAIVDGGAQLDDNSVKVNNTDTLAGENWSYVSNGKYQRNYRAHTAGGSINAELKMSGWSESQYSNNYTINPGEASPFTSQLRIRNLWTVVDGDLIVDAYLFDAFNNPLTNHFYLLTEGSVLLQNAFPKGGDKWVYAGDGQYERIYTAQRDGTNLQSRLELPGGTVNGQPYYDILPYVRVEALRVNGKTFSSLTGFPKTGFDGAKFTLILDNNASNTDYNWKADVNWITVSSGGEVLFKSAGISGWKATITGTPKNGRGNNVTFSVTLEKWFQSGGSALQRSWSDIKSQCSSGGHNLPDAVADLASYPSGGVVPREVGKLWGEYGDLTSYNSIFTSPDYWTNTMYEKFDPKTGMTSYAGAQSSSSLLCMEK
ncbi:inverse autotransporter beta domain-containing protein [Escherichia albertii]|uniref:inverse autotransporter beta domain-containing protein n=1 Tax=Escherichia albertii TaxID=208962 RepID=UPI00211A3FBC|nr:inverse autotransporter beta domain-containing protein [Escherichia albertii]MCQ8984043.1 inverse autotransporter beta domain-containing protein [Escherichia albertii]MCQ9015273.1 inverse autotransporter beta domain-containing protein [Escherichia albertii]UUL41630.1 inverse autotransporter beta domain-containing protein [Escherichia albertii]